MTRNIYVLFLQIFLFQLLIVSNVALLSKTNGASISPNRGFPRHLLSSPSQRGLLLKLRKEGNDSKSVVAIKASTTVVPKNYK